MRADSGVSLAQLAEQASLLLHGDPELIITGAAPLDRAGSGELSFLANPAYRARLGDSRAAAVVVAAADLPRCRGAALVADDPYVGWARALDVLYPRVAPKPGVHATAVIEAGARVAESAVIGALCHIAAGAVIGERAVIGPGSFIGTDAEIGADCRLVGRVWVGERCRLGRRVCAHPGVVIGADGFGIAMDDGRWRNVRQLGRVVIGDDCEIGANTTIDRGALGDTVLGVDVRIDNQVQIAHNVTIGDHSAIAGCVGIAGSTAIGRYCMIAGASGIAGHLRICDHVQITAMSTVLDSIDRPGAYGSGIPARPQRSWQRLLVRLGQLEQLFRRSRPNKDRS
ncbi:MAG: UDP-3-O-(3-hydroxymyristoyl)glucosamine N-acyltransferase [Wenzhouxiangellaceae bacterium]|nr:UDP-3-O-(3-hydroxymyristoyl)glucosamine N-acyltransferase [Wenzhouxiangellaceae bacterium]